MSNAEHQATRAAPEPTLVEATRDAGEPTAATPPPVPPGPPAPRPLAAYDLVREIGRGGMGIVYEARHRGTGKAVALKMMQWLDPALLLRFKQEFRTLAGLGHPNLVTLHELAADGPTWFFTMELIDGEPLLRHVRRGAAGPLGAAGLGRLRAALAQLADGLAVLHAAGKVHRDVKPSNVLVTPQGRVVLLDFGLAVEVGPGGDYQSVHPHVLGTIPYMAPEQAAALPVSSAADWYAVGVVLFEALLGRLPFEGAPLHVLSVKQQQDAPSPQELGPNLPADLCRLCEELLRRDPAARPSGVEVRRRLVPEQPAPPPLAEVPLVGRRDQLDALAEAFGRVRRGRTVVVAVHGRSGAGKSALLRHFLDGAGRDGAVVLAGRCYEQESVPYKALDSLIDALSRYLDGLPRAEVEALLPRDVAPLCRLFPVLGHVPAIAEAQRRPADASDPKELRRRGLAGLRELLARLGDRRPLLLAIDDLQWGDEDSMGVLSGLLTPPDPPALLLLAGYRSEDAETNRCLAAFDRLGDGGVDRVGVPVAPLTDGERRELAAALLGDAPPGRAEAIARQSGGFPFFIHELVRFARAGEALDGMPLSSVGDGALAEMIGARVGRLPAAARGLLEVVALAGRPLGVTAACRAAGLADAAAELARLRGERLVRTGGEKVETYHDRIREAVLGRLPADVRERHHAGLADALEAAGDADAEWRAAHHLGAGRSERAGECFAQAADRAAEALAFDRAARLYRQALELPGLAAAERRRLRTLLGDALARAGRGAEAAGEYLAAADGSPDALELRRRAALVLLSSGHVDAGMATLSDVLASVGLSLSGSPWRTLLGLAWQRLWLRLRGLRYRTRPAESVPVADLARLDVCLTAATGLSMVDTIQGAYFQSLALRLALRAGEPVRLACALAVEGGHESIAGTRSPRRARAMLDAADRLAEAHGDPYARAMVALSRGVAAALAGEWRRALALCDAAEGAFRATCRGVLWELGTAHRFAQWPLMYMGDLPELRRRLPGLLREARDRDDRFGETNLCLVVRTFLSLADDEPARARQELAELMARWSQQGFHVQHMNRLHDDTQIDLYEGAAGRGRDRLRAGWPLLERSQLLRVQQVRILMRHLRGRAALTAGESAAADARALRREGAAWADALGLLLEAGGCSREKRAGPAAARLSEAVRRCEAAELYLHAAAARRRLGELTGDAALVAAADAWMAQRQVARPARLAALLVPGFD